MYVFYLISSLVFVCSSVYAPLLHASDTIKPTSSDIIFNRMPATGSVSLVSGFTAGFGLKSWLDQILILKTARNIITYIVASTIAKRLVINKGVLPIIFVDALINLLCAYYLVSPAHRNAYLTSATFAQVSFYATAYLNNGTCCPSLLSVLTSLTGAILGFLTSMHIASMLENDSF